VAGYLEHGKEILGSIKYEELHDLRIKKLQSYLTYKVNSMVVSRPGSILWSGV